MPVRTFGFLIFIYAVLALLGALWEQSLGASNFSHLNTLLQFQLFELHEINLLVTTVRFPLPEVDWFLAFVGILALDFDFLDGNYNLIRLLLLVMVAVPLSFLLITRVGPALASMFRAVRG